jgi:hypothetical protein
MKTLLCRAASCWALAAATFACSGTGDQDGSAAEPRFRALSSSAAALTGSDLAPLPSAPQACGGVEQAGCPSGQICVYDPSDGCVPGPYSTCTGVCTAQPPGSLCGGAAGIPCPTGQTCALDSDSDCDPTTPGGCPGTCVAVE